MNRAPSVIALLAWAAIAACGRSDLGLERATAEAADGGPSSDAGAPADGPVIVADSAADVVTRDALPPVDITCPNLAGLQAHAPWPTMRRCPGRTASTPAIGPQHAPTPQWSEPLNRYAAPLEPVIAADGTVYVLDAHRGLLALTPGGATKWATPLSLGKARSAMLAIRSDGVVIVLAETVTAVRPDGSILWSPPAFACGGGLEVAADGNVELLVHGCQKQYSFEVLDPNGMGVPPGQPNVGPLMSLPAMGPAGDLYAEGVGTDGTPSLFAYTSSGAIDWRVPTTGVASDPFYNALEWPIVRDDGTVIFGDQGVRAVGADGSPRWSQMAANEPLAAGSDGTVYAGARALTAIHSDGTIAWQWGGGAAGGIVVDGNGTVYAGTGDGVIAIAADGTPIWKTSSAMIPVAMDAAGTLYATEPDGTILFALR